MKIKKQLRGKGFSSLLKLNKITIKVKCFKFFIFMLQMPDLKIGSSPSPLMIKNKDDSPSSSSPIETEIKNNEN